MTESTALTVQQRAVQALGMAEIASQLTELASKSTSIVEITNPDGYEQCRSARITLKNQRVEIEKRGKSARDDANAFAKAIISEEKKLIDIIQPEEKRLQAIESAHEAKIEAEKQARIEAEMQRVGALQSRVEDLKGDQKLTSLSTPELITFEIDRIRSIEIDDSFQEFQPQAHDARAAGLIRLNELLGAANARVIEEARIKAELEELARLREQQAENERKENARLAEEDRIAREKREAELAAEREQLRREREAEEQRQAAERAELDRQRKAQEDEALLRSMIASFIAIPTNAAGKSSSEIAQIIEDTKAIVIGDEFGALRDEAQKAVDLALRLLPSIHAHAAHFEAETKTVLTVTSVDSATIEPGMIIESSDPELNGRVIGERITSIVRPSNTKICMALAELFEVTDDVAHEWLMDYASFEK